MILLFPAIVIGQVYDCNGTFSTKPCDGGKTLNLPTISKPQVVEGNDATLNASKITQGASAAEGAPAGCPGGPYWKVTKPTLRISGGAVYIKTDVRNLSSARSVNRVNFHLQNTRTTLTDSKSVTQTTNVTHVVSGYMVATNAEDLVGTMTLTVTGEPLGECHAFYYSTSETASSKKNDLMDGTTRKNDPKALKGLLKEIKLVNKKYRMLKISNDELARERFQIGRRYNLICGQFRNKEKLSSVGATLCNDITEELSFPLARR